MRPGGKTVVIPGPGGVVILSPGFDSPLGPLSAMGVMAPGDAAGDDDPRPETPPDDTVEIFPAPFLAATASTSSGAPAVPAGSSRAWSSVAAPFRRFASWAFPPPSPDPDWERIREPVVQEIGHLRSLPGVAERQSYLRAVGDEVMARIQAQRATSKVGFHYNLHGGQADDYIVAGGILATRGDISIQHDPFHADLGLKVYFFTAGTRNLYDILDERNPHILFFPSRMGHVLIPFRLDSGYLAEAFAEGGASKETAISIDFDERWMERRHGGRHIGIPSDTFITPPLVVFTGVRQRLGIGRLSRDEETLAVMRYLEARAIASAPPQQPAAEPPPAPPAAAPANDTAAPEAPGAPPPPSEIPQLTSFRGPLDLYHTTPVAEGRDILAHGFVATQIDEEGTTAGVFYPAGYAGALVIRERRDVIPEGGSGIYFGLSGDDTWRGGSFGFWSLQWEGGFEIRVHVPADNGLRIVDLREPGNLAYVKQWARTHHTGFPLHGKHVDQFAAEHDIDILIRRGRTGRDSYEEVVFKSSRAYAYLNGLPREGHEPSSSDED